MTASIPVFYTLLGTAGSLVEAHVNEHGDGVVALVGRKEVVGLLPLVPEGWSATPQAMHGVLPMRCHTAAVPVGNDGLQTCCYAYTAL